MSKFVTAIISLILAVSGSVRADDDFRSGSPKDCYLYSFGKGPNWVAKVSSEFRLSLLHRLMPFVDEQYFEPTEKALKWIERKKEPTTVTIATINGRKVIEITYPEVGSFGKTIGTILLAIETKRGSGWFAPFFCAQPELFHGQFTSSKDVAFGYIATLEWSGTGALRSHYLFDLRKPHPAIVGTVDAGRVTMNEYKTEEAYKKALKVFDREADLLSGIIPRHK